MEKIFQEVTERSIDFIIFLRAVAVVVWLWIFVLSVDQGDVPWCIVSVMGMFWEVTMVGKAMRND